MPTKTTGAEFKRFYNDDKVWPEDAWHEDEEVTVNGDVVDGDFEQIPDEAVVTVEGGCVYGVSQGADPSFETWFKRWRKRQATAVLIVECDLSAKDALASVIKAAGGRIA